ncbi:putative disease resistance protein At1g50180 isoform X2 [Pyrus x bretschneideri]|uniref:putative disease resistance protein At1g50180 isoform X2 n=1 Tax=Pyrus x bretschneideri TaxID=225117 RepID=UPI00202F1976|nr:putative disease resistance protein At1g50180 isoform X2 [Pyrus x bretschneideri]
MAENVVTFLLERLDDMLREEANNLIKIPKQVKLLQKELEQMRSFLKDADSRQEGNDTVRTFVAQVRDAAYDAEDVIDTFYDKVKPQGNWLIKNIPRDFSSFLNCCTRVNLLKDVGSKIEDIKAHIAQLTQNLETFGIKRQVEEVSSSSKNGLKTLRRTYSREDDQRNIVGLGEDADRLSSQLVRQGSSRFVSICGMGGLGKTTLAKKVYHHDKVRGHFRYFVWVYVSQKCQAREIWEEILFKINEEKKKENEEKDKEIEEKEKETKEKKKESKEKKEEKREKKDHEISTELYDLLIKERCLVVLDDIWDANTWTALSSGFPAYNVKAETKMLLTSRNKDVAYRADPKGFLYEPACLSEDAAWELFQKIVFEHADHQQDMRPRSSNNAFITVENKKKLGNEMVPHCKGLPLAIVVLGGVLASKDYIDEWETIHKNIKSQLKKDIGSNEDSLGPMDLLALSYDDLPYQLKPCFLHLGQFPEDFEMPTRRLINLWVAEAIISPESSSGRENEETLEDVAYRYLRMLADRYLVQVEKRSSTGRIKSCRMHDLVREVCLEKARRSDFFHTIELRNSNRQMDFFSSMTLKNFPASIADVKDLTTLPNLRRLVIQIRDQSKLDEFLEIFQLPTKFQHLESLSIKDPDDSLELTSDPMPKISACCPRIRKVKLNSQKIFLKNLRTDQW